MSRGTSLPRGGTNSTLNARSALRALCARGLTSHALGLELRAPLRRLLEFDGYCLNTCDPATGVVTSSVGDGLSPENAFALFELEARGGDLNCLRDLYRGPTRVASLWLSTGGHPEQSERMREIFLALGFSDELRAALLTEDACQGYLHLFRGAGRAPFHAADLTEISAISTLVAEALRSAASRLVRCAPLQADEASRVGPALIVVDDADRVVQESPGAQAALGAPDSLQTDSGLAHVLRDVASRSRRGERPTRATLLTKRAELFSVSAVQLGRETAIVIDEPRAEERESRNSEAFGLTPREREVSRLVAAGHSNQSAAAKLGISLHTVKDHVRAVLAKTRCTTRSELAARLRGV